MRVQPIKTIEQLFRERAPITEALRKGVREAILRHKKLGESIVIWRDGKVVIVPPEQIEVDPVTNQ